MKKQLVKEVKCEVESGGPFLDKIVAQVKFEENGKTKFFSCVEVDGMPNFYMSDEDIYDKLADDSEEEDPAEEYFVSEYEGIEFSADYEDIFESINENKESDGVNLVRYLIAVVHVDNDAMKELVDGSIGKTLDEIEIPVSDVEQDYIDDNADF